MRVVRAPAELSHAVKTAQREAEAAFGVPRRLHREVRRVAAARRVPDPRRPVRNVIHLGERECSIQRRHQKLLEESPSPALSDKMRRKMGKRRRRRGQGGAIHERRHLRVPDGSGRAVLFHGGEHPPPGRASGHRDGDGHRHRQGADPHRGRRQKLSLKQSEVTFTGHSIECRINAEDPDTFVPSPGVIHVFSVPGGPGVRVETLAHSDCTISPYYDSMIAKVIVHGRDRHRSHRAHAPGARDDRHRGHQDDDSDAPAHLERSGIRRRTK